MSFKDFNDEGPGTFSWDYVLGGNTTGLFPEETHYVLEGDKLTEVTFAHTGGGRLEASQYGQSFVVENISPVTTDAKGNQVFSFDQGGFTYKATVNKKFKAKGGALVVDVEE